MNTTVVNERLAALTASGTAVWLDQIGRGLIDSGEMRRLVDECCVRGMTSNPSIFEQAILHSGEYEDELDRLAREGLSALDIYKRIAVRDVQQAADVLRPVWDQLGGADGFVSLEVSPGLARDDGGHTLAEAREFWSWVDRPNLMIKIPGTPEGVPAIEEAIYEGINVNVTLLFAVENYAAIAEAYIRGMERRHAEGKPLNVHSVASFFVSRVDTAVDKQLDELGRDDLKGQAALANARAAYRRFKEIFHGERFAALAAAGAPVQRPLWASTGTKNPAYSDVLYVDNLAGPETVNTMPMKTLLAAAEQSAISGPAVDADPQPVLDSLADAGIDLDAVTAKLLDEGIDAFVHSLDGLLAGIEQVSPEVAGGVHHAVRAQLPTELENVIAQRVARAHSEGLCARVWAKDESLWGGPGVAELGDRLGWLAVADEMAGRLGEISAWVDDVQSSGLDQIVLLGMGGSSLGPEVLRRSFGSQLVVLDSTDPAAVRAAERAVDLERTLFVVSSKSGGTIETLSHFRYFWDRTGGDGRRFAAVTDPGSPLEQLARDHGFNRVWLNDPEIGGRYSVMSHFGLVPAALSGVPVAELVASCLEGERECRNETGANTGLWLGLALGELALGGRDKLSLLIDGPIESFGLWAEQLIAESTGKRGKCVLPVTDEPRGEASRYGSDRVFLYLRIAGDHDVFASELAAAGHPVLTINVDGPGELGRLFFLFEFATAVAGHVLGVNPFDQPNVQEAKDATAAALESGVTAAANGTLEDLVAVLSGAAPPDYVALLAYVAPTGEFYDAAAGLRAAIGERTGVATTFGYGPRYLHSTGQLHKGGPPAGRFIQLIGGDDDDVSIPEAGFTFGQLKRSQAHGDFKTLSAHGRPVVQIALGGDGSAALRELSEQLRQRL